MEQENKLRFNERSQETVNSFLTALNNKDYKAARALLTDDFNFDGVMGKRDGADIYMADMEKMQFKYHIQKIIADENDVAVFYDINMGGPVIYSAGWYKLEAARIQSLKVVFDPRSLKP